jgi:hypothetical protein
MLNSGNGRELDLFNRMADSRAPSFSGSFPAKRIGFNFKRRLF